VEKGCMECMYIKQLLKISRNGRYTLNENYDEGNYRSTVLHAVDTFARKNS
jgi:hypothetical protein